MSQMWDSLTGEESRPEPRRRKPATSKGWQQRPSRPAALAPARPRTASKTRPPEVSERVWGLAEQWIEEGTAALGRHPRVSVVEFSKRFAARINGDRECQRIVKAKGHETLSDILALMITRFWNRLEEGQTDGVHQMIFLNDNWDDLLDKAITNWTVEWLKANGKPVEYTPPHRDDNAWLQVKAKQRVDAWDARCEEVKDNPPLTPPTPGRLKALWENRQRKS